MVEILKQDQYVPMSVENQVAIIWAGNSGHLDEIELDEVKRFEGEFIAYLETNYSSTLAAISEKGELTDEIVTDLEKAVDEFKKAFAS